MELIDATRALIARQLEQSKRPALACSFGKDSMVMLALVREQKPDIPVLYFEALPHPTKHAFAERIAREWNLNLILPKPIARDAIATGSHVELIEIFEIAPRRLMYFPIEAPAAFKPDADSHCALARLVTPLPVVTSLNFDGVFIGHRGDDDDPTYGEVPLISHTVDYGNFAYFYPLKDWTAGDIWRASSLLDIPQNRDRYERQDMSANNDYYPLCTECLKPSVRDTAFCPQLGRDVPNRGNEMDLYGRRRAWQQTFVNIDKVAGAQ